MLRVARLNAVGAVGMWAYVGGLAGWLVGDIAVVSITGILTDGWNRDNLAPYSNYGC